MACVVESKNLKRAISDSSNKENFSGEKRRKIENQKSIEDILDSNVPSFLYKELEKASCGWSEGLILGKGGFATVYLGQLQKRKMAIKRIECNRSKSEARMKRDQMNQLRTETMFLSKTVHENIIGLFGFSLDQVPCLVYDFMPKGTLKNRLGDTGAAAQLTWAKRLKIAVGVAHGLHYLHNFGPRPIIHTDIKPGNILLDKNMEPKIGDFGLARMGKRDGTMIRTNRAGTTNYLPPEYLKDGIFSTKVDIYAYGMVLLEMATNLKVKNPKRKQLLLKNLIQEHLANNEVEKLMDPKAGEEDDIVFCCLIIMGEQCLNDDRKERPRTNKIIKFFNTSEPMAEIMEREILLKSPVSQPC